MHKARPVGGPADHGHEGPVGAPNHRRVGGCRVVVRVLDRPLVQISADVNPGSDQGSVVIEGADGLRPPTMSVIFCASTHGATSAEVPRELR
jgi:hypothetical protein